jgi:hypothetical protein
VGIGRIVEVSQRADAELVLKVIQVAGPRGLHLSDLRLCRGIVRPLLRLGFSDRSAHLVVGLGLDLLFDLLRDGIGINGIFDVERNTVAAWSDEDLAGFAVHPQMGCCDRIWGAQRLSGRSQNQARRDNQFYNPPFHSISPALVRKSLLNSD